MPRESEGVCDAGIGFSQLRSMTWHAGREDFGVRLCLAFFPLHFFPLAFLPLALPCSPATTRWLAENLRH